MKKLSVLAFAVLLIFLFAGTVVASPFVDESWFLLQNEFNYITVDGDSSIDVRTDFLSDNFDSYWKLTGTEGSTSTFIYHFAAFHYSNVFGIFDYTDPSKTVELFYGGPVAGDMVNLQIKSSGEVWVNDIFSETIFGSSIFGYYLDSSFYAPYGGFAYSDTALNDDGFDHMLAYQGKGDKIKLYGWTDSMIWTPDIYMLAFEDLVGSVSDWDFNDFVVMVESVRPVSEPATMLLLGSGLILLAGKGRKKFFKKG